MSDTKVPGTKPSILQIKTLSLPNNYRGYIVLQSREMSYEPSVAGLCTPIAKDHPSIIMYHDLIPTLNPYVSEHFDTGHYALVIMNNRPTVLVMTHVQHGPEMEDKIEDFEVLVFTRSCGVLVGSVAKKETSYAFDADEKVVKVPYVIPEKGRPLIVHSRYFVACREPVAGV